MIVLWRKKKQMNKLDREWKNKNEQYIEELQSFFDSIDNIEDGELRKRVRNQMLMCDKVLTETAEDMFNFFYNEGYRKAKEG